MMMMMMKSPIKNVVALMTMIKSTIKKVVAMMMMIKKSMTSKFNATVMAIMMNKSRRLSDKGMNIVMIQE
jgi:hypothetical protein